MTTRKKTEGRSKFDLRKITNTQERNRMIDKYIRFVEAGCK